MRLDAPPNTADVQYFLTPGGTWTKPAGAKMCYVVCIGAGGGGGSGRRGAPGTNRYGGGAGAAGYLSTSLLPAAELPDEVTVLVSAPGVGGAPVTTDDTNGNDAVYPGAESDPGSFFGTYVRARAGAQGSLGTATNGISASVPSGGGMFAPGPAGNGGLASGVGAINSAAAPGSGGGGAGLTTGDSSGTGGKGGYIGAVSITAGVGAPGAVSDTPPRNASPSTDQPVGTSGAGGSGGSVSQATPGGSGANGAAYGGGGGGGSASANGYASGAGGNGGPGIVVVTSYF
jgi:hypothetical protein